MTVTLQKIDENFERWNVLWATVSCTTQITNILGIDQLFRYIREKNFKHITAIPQLMPLFYPNYFSIQALPPEAKAVARELLKAEIARAEAMGIPGLNGTIGSIRSTLAFLTRKIRPRIWTTFCRFRRPATRCFTTPGARRAPELAMHLDKFRAPKRGLSGLLQRLTA